MRIERKIIMLKVTHTEQYTATIEIDGKQVKTLSQAFDENGLRNGGIGEYVMDKNSYNKNLTECRYDEDTFLKQMRDYEDSKRIKEDE